MKINEKFLHFVWRHGLFNPKELKDEWGQEVFILERGNYNLNAGPDFLEAKIRIGNEIWAGSIEVHMKPSDWYRHNHQADKRYNNVILHLVYDCEGEEAYIKKLNIPTLKLKGLIPYHYVKSYEKMNFDRQYLPCSKFVPNIDSSKLYIWYERLLIERIEKKVSFVRDIYHRNNNDWEKSVYEFLAYNWGMKLNSEAFLKLAVSLPLHILRKYRNQDNSIEVLLFGQSGLLGMSENPDKNTRGLIKQFAYFKKLYNLEPIPISSWYFFQLRPSAFPTIRLSLWHGFLTRVNDLEAFVMDNSLKQLDGILKSIELSEYWKSHYVFGKKTKVKSKSLGKDFVKRFIINAIIPLRVFNFERLNIVSDITILLKELESFSPENNAILRRMELNGFRNENVNQSQALLQLYNNYCIPKKCLNCRVGNDLLRFSDRED